MNIVSLKECRRCGASKPLEQFGKDSGRPDGKFLWCKTCASEYSRRYVEDNKDKVNAYQRAYKRGKPRQFTDKVAAANKRYKATPKGKDAVARRNKAYREKNREKIRVQRRANIALDKGLIARRDTCERCPSQHYVHMHHEDYSKPLEVIWLCARCHRAADRARQ